MGSLINIFDKYLNQIMNITYFKPYAIAIYEHYIYVSSVQNDIFEIMDINDPEKILKQSKLEYINTIFISLNGMMILTLKNRFDLYDSNLTNKYFSLKYDGAFNAGLDSNGKLVLLIGRGKNQGILVSK